MRLGGLVGGLAGGLGLSMICPGRTQAGSSRRPGSERAPGVVGGVTQGDRCLAAGAVTARCSGFRHAAAGWSASAADIFRQLVAICRRREGESTLLNDRGELQRLFLSLGADGALIVPSVGIASPGAKEATTRRRHSRTKQRSFHQLRRSKEETRPKGCTCVRGPA